MAGTVMKEIESCLASKKNFLLSGGAGSGKTYTLIETLHYIYEGNPKASVACITFTNVAVSEIRSRSPYSKLRVSTIHDFLWNEIKGFQKNLKSSILYLIYAEKTNKGDGLPYRGDSEINEQSFSTVEYQNYRDLEQGIISHDDLLIVASFMFEEYPLLSKILCDKYDYILIDEYQDTQKKVIEIFLKHIKTAAMGNLCVGFFGDKMQSIYDNGVVSIKSFVDSGDVYEVVKEDNYRCSVNVINLLNKLRSDIVQKPAKKSCDGKILNKIGSAKFIYSPDKFDLTTFIDSKFARGWNLESGDETRLLYLTHRLNANQVGFLELLSSYSNSDMLLGNEPDRLARHFLKVGSILYHYAKKDFAFVISEMQRKLKNFVDKNQISNILTNLCENLNTYTIEQIIDAFDEERLVRKDDRFSEYIDDNPERYSRIKVLPASQIVSYYTYYNRFSPFSTQHGIKGAEFDNVLVIMDNGGWNSYNFKYLFEQTLNKASVLERTERIFYVCCSRAMDNLVVFCTDPSSKMIEQAKYLFGEENVYSLV